VDQRNPVPPEIVEEVAHDFDLDTIDPTQRAPAQSYLQPTVQSTLQSTNGDHPPLIESLLQALNTLVDRLNQAEAAAAAPGDQDRERKS
jgi:hypothetical protein